MTSRGLYVWAKHAFSSEERGVTTLGWDLEAKPGTGLLAPAPVLNTPDTTAALQPEGRVPVTTRLTGPWVCAAGVRRGL
jgi:hypothetical protein